MLRIDLRSSRGNVLLFALIMVFALMLSVGFVVDGGGRIAALQRADSIAREAARFAGQAMTPAALRGTSTKVDPAAGRVAAQRYLAAADVTGTVSVRGTTVHVEVRIPYEPKFLSIIGIHTVTMTGEAVSEPANVYQGAP